MTPTLLHTHSSPQVHHNQRLGWQVLKQGARRQRGGWWWAGGAADGKCVPPARHHLRWQEVMGRTHTDTDMEIHSRLYRLEVLRGFRGDARPRTVNEIKEMAVEMKERKMIAKKMAPPVLYYMPYSAPCRSVLLAAKHVGLELTLKNTDLMKKEHLTPEFIAINPQHTIPTFVEDDFILWESRAIVQYIANTHDKTGLLYPKEPKLRSKIDRLLYFDFGSLYKSYGDFA
ncbi:Glutathione S-transferase N-terminal, partial [Trinorchestia longiramus]